MWRKRRRAQYPKYTEYSRAALALTALGQDPSDVGGYNLLTPLAITTKRCGRGSGAGLGAHCRWTAAGMRCR
jgi:hypothetical protein